MNYGLIHKKITSEQYNVLGGSPIPDHVVQSDGDWSNYLPSYEAQFNAHFDTFGCTIFGGQNQIETYLKKLTNYEFNFSERYNYIIAQITPPGADVQHVYEVIRHYGLIDNDLLPMLPTYKDFLRPNPMTDTFIDIGLGFLKDWEFKHEWLWGYNMKGKETLEMKKALIAEYLKYSPIAVSVYAWNKNNKGEYSDKGRPNTHWCLCYKMEDDQLYIFDSYDHSHKVLDPDHNIEIAKRIYMKRKEVTPSRLRQLLEKLYQVLFVKHLWLKN